ncbi:hypothetical protein C0992_012162 [Termitomyces sp. T32_za158]|nr:hypothetical protein C0992_012162 [Termitomyces sp. T32_za158]
MPLSAPTGLLRGPAPIQCLDPGFVLGSQSQHELAPLAPCAPRGPGIFLGEELDSSTVPGESFLPQRALCPASCQLLAADKVFPQKVQCSLKNGMLKYIPLDLLTDEACRIAAHEPPAPELAFVIANGKLHLPNTTFDSSREGKLSFDDWSGASNNLVKAMQKHLRADSDGASGGPVAQEIANSFAGHFRHLKALPNSGFSLTSSSITIVA